MYGKGRNDLVFVIHTRPFIGGEAWMPYAVAPETHKIGVTSVAPDLIPYLAESGMVTTAYGGGALISYKETASSVALRSWQTKLSSFTFEVADTDDGFGKTFAKRLPRGMILQVDCGFSDYQWTQFQRINLGTVRQVTNANGKFIVTCDEIFSAMTSPSGTAARSHLEYESFGRAGSEVVITESVANNQVAIDIDSNIETFYAMTDLRDHKDRFCLQTRVTADPPNTVYLQCSKSAAGSHIDVHRLIADDALDGGYDWFSTAIGFTDAETPTYPKTGVIASDTTAKLFYVVGDGEGFLDTFYRIATSTGQYGTGDQNGDFDTLHSGLGFGIPHQLLWEWDTRNWFESFGFRSLGFHWTPFFGSPEADGWGLISGALSNFGIWPVMKEGELTLRCAISHTDSHEGVGDYWESITDDQIESVKKHEWFHTNTRDEYFEFRTFRGKARTSTHTTSYDTGIDSIVVDTRPFNGQIEVSTINGPRMPTGPIEPDATTCWDFQSQHGSENARTFVSMNSLWYTRVPEHAEIVCAGLMYASLCPGDIVKVTSQYLFGPEGYWTARSAMVQSVHRDWIKGRVTLGLAALPTQANRFE